MKTVEIYKKEFEMIKTECSFLLNKLSLKFSVEEFLIIDSITFNDIPILQGLDPDQLKRDYLILANETYRGIDEKTLQTVNYKTRTLIFSLRQSKIMKMKIEHLYNILFDFVKLLSFYEKNKLLKKELENQINISYPEIATWHKIMPFVGVEDTYKKIDMISDKAFNNLNNFYVEILRNDLETYNRRSDYLYDKLKKKKRTNISHCSNLQRFKPMLFQINN